MSLRPTPWAILAAAGLACVLPACSGPATSTRDDSAPATAAADDVDLDGAQAQLDQYTGEYTWTAPGPAFDASAAAGSTVTYIPVDNAIPIFGVIYGQLEQALSSQDVTANLCDGQGSPGQWTSCIDDAVGRGSAVIILDSFPASAVSEAVDRARAAGVKVIDANNGDPGTVPAGADARVSFPYSLAGNLVADWIVTDSGGDANVLIIQSPEVGNVPDLVGRGYQAGLSDRCPTTCSVTTVNVAIADWATKLQSTVQSQLAANPDIDYVIPIYDGMATYVVPGIQAAGAAGTVTVATFNASLDAMKKMADGDVIGVDVGTHNAYEGWAFADQSLRLAAGEPPVADENVPVRVFTRENVDDLELTQDANTSGAWFGDDSYQDEYRQLWAG